MKNKNKLLSWILLLTTANSLNSAIIQQDVTYTGNLGMTIYYDDTKFSSVNNCTRLPFREVMILMHGGYFLNGSRFDMSGSCISFAKLGYVAITIDYRKGGYSLLDCNPSNGYNIIKAAYRATQDGHEALKYVKNNIASLVPDVSADHIFMGGWSAGAFIALNLGFVQQAEINADYPLIEGELGPLVREPRIYPSLILNNAGAVTNLQHINERFPFVVNMAGKDDRVVPYDEAFYLNCPSHPYLYGTEKITRRLSDLGACYLTVTSENGTHFVFTGPAQEDYVASIVDGMLNDLYSYLWERSHCPALTLRTGNLEPINSESPRGITITKGLCDYGSQARNSGISKSEPESFSSELALTPNETKVLIRSEITDRFKLEVYTINGQLVYKNNEVLVEKDTPNEFYVPHLDNGLFIIKTESLHSGHSRISKLLIQNH